MFPCLLRLCPALILAIITPLMAQTGIPAPPIAKMIPREMVNHGDKRVDDYFWLRDKDNSEVIAYLKAENAYTDAVMKPQLGFRDQLYKEMLARIKETDQNVPYRKGDYFYYSRTEEGKQYPIYCRRHGSLEAAEQVVLDLNELAIGKAFLALGVYEVSPDGRWLAYSLDVSGFREYTLYFKDLESGRVLDDKIEKVDSAAWANDNKTVFYATEDAAKRPYRLYRHVLGAQEDALLFEEKDELYRIGVETTRSRGYVVLSSESSETTEAYVLEAGQPEAKFRLVQKRKFGHKYYVDHHDREFFIRTNDKGRNYRLAVAPLTNPAQSHWKQVVAQRNDVMLDGIDIFANFYVAVERRDGLPQMRIMSYGKEKHPDAGHAISFGEEVYNASPGANAEYQTRMYRFNFESLVTPASVFDYDIGTRERKLLKQQPVLGGYDATQYQAKRLYATAPDGTRVPISMVYRKALRNSAPQPMLLYGYGSYGIPMDVGFRSRALSLLDRGMIFAIAHIRGGGEMGEKWHDDGKMMNKKNTFADFIACAEYLVREGYTEPAKLVIQGGSAGGLLMGAVTNMRPDLFKAVVSQVPFVDVLNSMLDASLPLTVGEYLEWGNPNEPKAYRYMRAYSPYDNLEKKAYPAMLVETSLNDSQVMYWEPAKYVARLRTLKTDDNVLLLKINMDAGHGGASGRYDYLKEIAFTYAFILSQLGLAK
jgi:oligopeptidase B